MPIFVSHVTLPTERVQTINRVTDHIEETKKLWEDAGGKLLHWFVVAGDYDYLLISEASSEKVMAEIAAMASASGHMYFETLKCVPIEAFNAVVKRGAELSEIEWIESNQPRGVVGLAPDGGFYIHSSLHPFGTQGALDRSRLDGIDGQKRNNDLYFPMPWIRSELASVLKYRAGYVPRSLEKRVSVALKKTVPMLLKRDRLSYSKHLR